MAIEIGKKSQNLDKTQKAERIKKAVKIAMRSPYHAKKIAEKGNIKDFQTILDQFDEATDLKEIKARFQDIRESHKELGAVFEAEVTEIANSHDAMLAVGHVTSYFSSALSILPFAWGAHIHQGIRSVCKQIFGDALGFKNKEENACDETHIMPSPLEEEEKPEDKPEDKPKHKEVGHSSPLSLVRTETFTPKRPEPLPDVQQRPKEIPEEISEDKPEENAALDNVTAENPLSAISYPSETPLLLMAAQEETSETQIIPYRPQEKEDEQDLTKDDARIAAELARQEEEKHAQQKKDEQESLILAQRLQAEDDKETAEIHKEKEVKEVQEAKEAQVTPPSAEVKDSSQAQVLPLMARSKSRGKDIKANTELYNALHDDVRNLIVGKRNMETHQYSDFSLIDTELTQQGWPQKFDSYASSDDQNPLSRYVAALDRAEYSQNYDAIHIHHAAVAKACENDPENTALQEAKKYFDSAIAISVAFSSDDTKLKAECGTSYDAEVQGKLSEKLQPDDIYGKIKSYLVSSALSHATSSDKDLADKVVAQALEQFNLEGITDNDKELLASGFRRANSRAKVKGVKRYRDILEQYGSAPFTLREGAKGKEGFTHYGTAIIEKKENGTYRLRIENPTRPSSLIYAINPDKVNHVLNQLLTVYMNGNPFNNLGKDNDDNDISVSDIAKKIIGEDNFEGEAQEEERQEQDGLQCGIHSSRRIIPDALYRKAGVQDCDILGLVEKNAVSEAQEEESEEKQAEKRQGLLGRLLGRR